MAVPYTFATATTTLPLSQLDANFAYFGNAITVSAGNVGIGTSSPSVKFSIEQNQAAYSYFDHNNITNGGGVVWRQVVRNIANTGTTTVDLAKLIGGGFTINNNDPNASNYTSFGVGGSESMRIDSGGNLLVGTTSVLNNSKVTIVNNNPQIVVRHSSATAGKYWNANYVDASSNVFVINQNNTGVVMADGASAWSANSDERLKDIIAPITSALEGVQSLRAVRYSWKSDEAKVPHIGLIAQDVQKILPEVVHSAKLPMSEDETEYLSVAYTEVIPLLVAAIQELSAKNDALEARLVALEAK
jgi:hypothetical protein